MQLKHALHNITIKIHVKMHIIYVMLYDIWHVSAIVVIT